MIGHGINVTLILDGGSDCRFLETAVDHGIDPEHSPLEQSVAYVYVSCWPLPLGIGLALHSRNRNFGDWFYRSGKY